MIQYNSSYSSIPSSALNLFYSKLSPLDEYIIFQTDQYKYSMLVNPLHGDITQYDITRANSSYSGNYYNISSHLVDSFDYSYSNEYYVYSNLGIGIMDVKPVDTIIQSWSVVGICLLLFLGVLFRGLFSCDRKRRYW